ncbi:NHL repeat domain protein [Hydrogenimonas sp.]|nr:NHL repeat domain protein [Hydrogenimonas sp.]
MKRSICYALFLFLTATSLHAGNGPVWPQPPEEARIKFEKKITNAEDLNIKKGFFSKIWDFFAGSEDTELIKPFGIHVDGGKIYVTDIGLSSLVIFDKDNNKVRVIQGFKSEKFSYPVDVATDAKGNIYLTDSVKKAVYVFNKEGIALKKIGSENVFKRPTGIAIDKKRGILYVSDTLSSQIKRFSLRESRELEPVGSHGNLPDQFNRPTFITVDEDGRLYVCDSMNFKIKIFDKNGKFDSAFGRLGNTIGSFASPRGVAVDREGNIYVTDTLFNAVQIFDQKGNLLLVFGSKGTGDGEFYGPEDIAISKDGRAYVTDSYNMRIELFDILGYNKNK